MIFLLYLLLAAFILIETPIIIMMGFLLTYRVLNGKVAKLRRILFIVLFTNFIFILGQIILIIVSITKISDGFLLVIWSYTLFAILLCAVNWWSLFQLKKLT